MKTRKNGGGQINVLQNASLEKENDRDGVSFIFIIKRKRVTSARHDE